jgi:two-component system CheB/CheR fusion protein
MNVTAQKGLEAVEHVVAIGASAGGLEALEALFDHLAPNTGAAFVVITHLSPDFKSIMDELLGRRTAMPVHVVEDGEPLEANRVYVIPPGKDMIVQAGRLFLTDRQGHGAPSAPIDLFFGSLARAFGRRATGVILSGTGADGARGARALREAGGYVVAQSLDSARFDGMPRAAQESGAVDAMLAPEAIGPAISARMARLDEGPDAPMQADAGEASEVAPILERVLGGANVDFSEYKKSTILRRIARRMQIGGVASYADYVARLDRDPAEVRALAEDLLIVVTEFFRDAAAFDLLAEKVMPELIAGAGDDRPIRIWAPAVGTGQEAYSLAMLLREAAARAGREPRVQIFATDISPTALERAALGVYAEVEMTNVSTERRAAFFSRTEDGCWQVRPEIRNWIVFATHNVLRDPPFINTNLISCRNALIYLETSAQNKALSLFHFSLAQDGFLLLGPSESIGEDVGRFVAVDARWRLFRKRGADRRDAAAMGELIGAGRWGPDVARRRPTPSPAASRGPNAAALQAALELFAPAGLLIDRDRDLQHIVGAGQKYLTAPAAGAFTRDVLKLVRPGLRAALSAALERALRTGEAAAYTGGDGDESVVLTAHPLPASDGAVIERVFVVFGAPPPAAAPLDPTPFDKLAEQRIAYLEDSLRAERENLQAMLEQLETSNEELQSTNEELMTANEELQSTNEELHSVNEELYTVNAEYERKNEELTQLTKDVSSLLQATGVGVVFVDRRMQVRRFTTMATRVVNLIPGDEGRDLRHITHRLEGFDLCRWLDEAMARGALAEVERRATDGTVWTVRAAPMGDNGGVSGAVVSLIEVSRLVSAEAEAKARSAELARLLGWVGAASLHFSSEGRLLHGAGDWRALTGQAPSTGTDMEEWLAMIHPEDAPAVAAAWRGAQARAEGFELSARLRRPDGTWREARLAGGPAEGDGTDGWLVYARDGA